MPLKHLDITHLTPHEVRPQHLPRMLPRRAIGGEDALTKKRFQQFLSTLAQTERLEIRGQDRLHVFGLDGRDESGHL